MGDFKVTIIVAAHKVYRMPEDSMYIPVHVGAEGKDPIQGYQPDNVGKNISALNPSFCELTGLYWAWKNLVADYIGLAHYRRHFSLKKNRKDPWASILTSDQINSFLGTIRVFTPGKRRYYIESLYSHYAHTHYAYHLDETRKIISEKCPTYLDSYDKVIKQKWGYMFNMMIMETSLFNEYCTWLFELLFELKSRIDGKGELSTFQGRFYGRVSEILFNVWLRKQINDGAILHEQIKELKVVHMEPVNWIKKGGAFLKAKYLGKKYEGSF